MTDELDKKLVEKYPKIFRDRHADMKETAMCWGFDHGDGWYDIIDKLCEKVQSHCDSHPETEQIIALQVKEKFGGLRFYTGGGDSITDKMIQEAEDESYEMCEFCGTKENIGHTSGWISTICENCFEKHLKDRRTWKPIKK